ncbi:hypothetical protein Gorai_004667 [Gossypium raimondii]|uniref:Uncharacterized protein n=1 Tax=Gossypium raimondii TaxID=29730 RepID=A0A7J8QK13_GOSRA|nr:hypothetical protein [Gossypium raimondii]
MRSFPLTSRLHLLDKALFWSVLSAVLRKKTLIHTVKDFPIAREILSTGGLDNSLITKNYHCCMDWLEDVKRVLDKRVTVNLMTTLWNSWNNRNNFIFCGKEEEMHVVWERARTFSQDFCIFNLINNPLLPANPAVITGDYEGFVIGGGGGQKRDDVSRMS